MEKMQFNHFPIITTVKPVLKATCISNHLPLKATNSDPIKGNEVEIYLY